MRDGLGLDLGRPFDVAVPLAGLAASCGLPPPPGGGLTIAPTVVHVRSRGRGTLRSADPRWRPAVEAGYYTDPAAPELAVGTTDYGIEFASVLARDNVFAAQFHPEKSQQAGLTLLANFVRWDGQP